MSLTHEQSRQLIQKSLVTGLSEAERIKLSEHLKECSACEVFQRDAVDFDMNVIQSLASRWPAPHYTRTDLEETLTVMRNRLGRQKMWNTLSTIGRVAAGAVILLIIIAGLAWLVGGTAPLVPGRGIVQPTATAPQDSGCMAIDNYQVLEGDSLDSIAKMFGISPEQIQRLNGLSGEPQPGQSIKLMGCPMNYGTPFPQQRYQVQTGDTCQSIGSANGVNVVSLAALNGLDADCQLTVGQTIILPLPASVPAVRKISLYYFSGDRCSKGCAEARQFLDGLMGRTRGLDVVEYNAQAMETNQVLYERMAARAGIQATVLPAIFLGDRFWIGFERSTGADIEAAIQDCQANGCADTQQLVGGYPDIQSTPISQSGQEIRCGETVDLLVRESDTVISIAQEFGVPADLVRLVNGIDGDTLIPGSHIRVVGCPINYGTPYPEPLYDVKAGDTCLSIASEYQVRVESLRVLNHLSTACEISIGQKLVIPWFEKVDRGGETTPAPETSGRISMTQAEDLVRDWVFANQPDMNPEAVFPLQEITPEEAWQRMQVQVFKVTDGVKLLESFLVQNGQVIPLGTAFGGMGVDHMLVTDLDGNNAPELLFTYSFGSGIHQSSMGIVVIEDGKPQAILAADINFQGDFSLRKTNDQEVYLAGIPNGQVQVEDLGVIHFENQRLFLAP